MPNLPKVTTRGKKIIGRGIGSGKGGHTVGRGQKGQKARGNMGILFEGVKAKKSLLRRLPLKRGKAKFHPAAKPLSLSVDKLETFPAGAKVTLESVIKQGLVDASNAKKYGVKILSGGKLTKKLEVYLPVSKKASEQILKAKGKIV